jgi:hypothetical protein
VRKFKIEDSKAMATPMSTTKTLDADNEGEHVDQKQYRSMIGSILCLTTMKSDIQFSVCLCARFQAFPRTSHRQAVKHIFRYLRHTPDFGLWYSVSFSLALVRHGYPWVPTDQAHDHPRQVGPAYQKTRRSVSGPNRPSWRLKDRYGEPERGGVNGSQ